MKLCFLIIFLFFFHFIPSRNSSTSSNNNFMNFNEVTDTSLLNETRSLYLAKQSKLISISFVNGIMHSVEDWERISEYLSQSFGVEVQPFYNPTSGSWIRDATKAGYELVVRPSDLKLAKDLAEHLTKLLNQLSKNGRVLHIAHSGGAIVTYLAAKYHLSKEQLDRIDIITLGGGRSITKKYFNGYIVNYYSKNDPLVLVDSRASKLLKKGRSIEKKIIEISKSNVTIDSVIKKPIKTISSIIDRSILKFSNQLDSYINNSIAIHDNKHYTSFVFLDGLADDPLVDHSMEGPTYRLAIVKESIELHKRLNQLLNMNAREKSIIRLSRKRFANITGLHGFWSKPYSSIYQSVFPIINNNSITQRLYHKTKELYKHNFSPSINITNATYLKAITNNLRILRKSTAKLTNIHGFFSKKNYDVDDDNTTIDKMKLLNETNIMSQAKQSKLIALSFVNGIMHSVEDWQKVSDFISQSFGVPVIPFYNPTTGSWIKDATKAGIELTTRPSDLKLAKDLAIHLTNILNQLSKTGRVLHIAHSGGAILTYIAAKYHLTKDQLERIDVITLGGGRSITKKYFHGYVVNYYSKNDPLLLVDQRAAKLWKRSRVLEKKMITSSQTNITMTNAINRPFETLGNIIDKSLVRLTRQLNKYINNSIATYDSKHLTPFIFLDGQANDPLIDHSMFGPTYRLAIVKESVELYKRLYQVLSLKAKERNLIRKARKRVANITGFHHFWNKPITSIYSTIYKINDRINKSFIENTKKQIFSSINVSYVLTQNIYLNINKAIKEISKEVVIIANSDEYISIQDKNNNTSSNLFTYLISKIIQNIRYIRKKAASITNLHGLISKKKSYNIIEESNIDAILINITD